MHFKTALSKNHVSILLPQKMHFKIDITKIFFISSSINYVKDKTGFNNNNNNNKSLMYGPILAIHKAFIIIIKAQSYISAN